jgi:hypothetical protein
MSNVYFWVSVSLLPNHLSESSHSVMPAHRKQELKQCRVFLLVRYFPSFLKWNS